MRWRIGKSPYLRSVSEDADDLLLLTNSFEPRCLFAASTAVAAGYRAKKICIINYESANSIHAKVKGQHRLHFDQLLADIAVPAHVQTKKYDVIAFADDIRRYLEPIESARSILVDITTFTKCTLATILTILKERFTSSHIRCVWTPGIYGNSVEITRGVRKPFVVPGFGGVGWGECRVLILFLGQEIDRSHSLWRAVDPDLVYLIGSDSEYSSVSAEKVLESAKFISSLVETRELLVDGVNPAQNEETLRNIESDLRARGYQDEVAVACFGTKVQLLGLWSFLRSQRYPIGAWHFVYAAPRLFVGNRYTRDYCRELNEIDLIDES